MQAFCPDGHHIQGALVQLLGRVNLAPDSFEREPGGKLAFRSAGYTEVFYGESEIVKRAGQRVFLCGSGEEFLENQLVLRTSP